MKNKPFTAKDDKALRYLRALSFTKVADLSAVLAKSAEPVPYEERETLKYSPLKSGRVWTETLYKCAWIHVTGTLPEGWEDQADILYLHIDFGGEGLLYAADGSTVDMLSDRTMRTKDYTPDGAKNMVPLRAEYIADGKIDFWIEAGFNGQKHDSPQGKAVFRFAELVALNDEVCDFLYDYLAVTMLKNAPDISGREQMEADLEKALSVFTEGNIPDAKEILAPYFNGEPLDFDVYAIGHSHLDLAWLWPLRETKRKAERTFTRQLYNLENDPAYIYGASQPWQFEQIKAHNPALYEKIRQAVAEGRLEPQGGMYVEADTNISGGEALIRQFHYGMDFFKKEFGRDMRICWLPDVFGYNGNLPQIIKKSGLDYFFTIKLSWNEHNRFPHRSFNWYGIDGSRVLVHMAPAETYTSDASPAQARLSYTNYPEKEVSGQSMMVFGMGDGGGGPSDVHLELVKRERSMAQVPRVHYTTAEDYFKLLEEDEARLPEYHGELYLEKHQGTYTTQAKNKFYNRKCEIALQDLETLSVMAYLGGLDYDADFFERTWKEILLYQFHDILPGSSIGRVYKESTERYRQMLSQCTEKRGELLRYLSGSGSESYVYNPAPYARREIIDGKLAEVGAFSTAPLCPVSDLGAGLRYDDTSMSNGLLSVIWNDAGEIVSMQDAAGFEYAGEYLNRLVVYDDPRSHYNAWDINWKYFTHRGKRLRMVNAETFTENGAVIVRRQAFRYHKSLIIQEYRLSAMDDVLRVTTEVSWQETDKMLRAESRPAVFADEVSCDIQYGTIRRSTKDETLLEQAQFEICAHKFVDVSDGAHGFSLLNDCKYGYRVKEGLISLNLLRSPVYPDPNADRGDQSFTYAFYPHEGAELLPTQKRAFWLNNPLRRIRAARPFTAPVSVPEESGVVLALMKKAYGSDEVVLRFYESAGRETDVTPDFALPHSALYEADLQEQNRHLLVGDVLHFTPYEIKTVIIKG